MILRCALPFLVLRSSVAVPLASVLRQEIGFREIELVWRVASLAEASTGPGYDYAQKRNFGLGKNASAGHSVIFVHDHFQLQNDTLRTLMHDVGHRLVQEAGWESARVPLTIRCVELIKYESNNHKDENIGWHTDGATILTMAIMLSRNDDFQGGQVNLRSEDGMHNERYDLDAGDVIAWRGWTEHQVQPVVSGRRDVFVIEWWSGEDVNVSGHPRNGDHPDALKQAIKVDPASSHLRRLLGLSLCKFLPCEDPALAREAELAYREALRLQPQQANAHKAFGKFLLGNSESWTLGFAHIHQACLLDPHRNFSNIYCYPWSFYSALLETFKNCFVRGRAQPNWQTGGNYDLEREVDVSEIFEQAWRACIVIALLVVLMPTLWWLEKREKLSAKKIA